MMVEILYLNAFIELNDPKLEILEINWEYFIYKYSFLLYAHEQFLHMEFLVSYEIRNKDCFPFKLRFLKLLVYKKFNCILRLFYLKIK